MIIYLRPLCTPGMYLRQEWRDEGHKLLGPDVAVICSDFKMYYRDYVSDTHPGCSCHGSVIPCTANGLPGSIRALGVVHELRRLTEVEVDLLRKDVLMITCRVFRQRPDSLIYFLKYRRSYSNKAFIFGSKLLYVSASGEVYAGSDVYKSVSAYDINLEYVPSELCYTFTAVGQAYKLHLLTQTEIDLLMLFS